MEQLQIKKDTAVSAAEEIDLSIKKQVLFMQLYFIVHLFVTWVCR